MAAVTTGSLATIPTTRRSLLLQLKKRGDATADELAGQLDITANAVRQHLAALAADGLVAFRTQRGTTGRPQHRYHLTDDGDLLFPRAYGSLTTELLEYVEDSDPALLNRIFERRAQRRLEETQARLAGKPFAARVAELARVLDEDGYLAEAFDAGDGTWRIVEHNCAILTVAQRYGHACSSELDFLRAALPDASVERVAHLLAGAHVCAYLITPT
jgi:DeoR family suf operon transcriptional repressor